MAQNQTLYDTSPQDHPLYSSPNKKVLEKLKDECAGRAIAKYVGLRPKMYSILRTGGKSTKKVKGVKKIVVKKHIRHEQYKEALFEKQTFRHGMDVLWSERHRIYGQNLNKVVLSPLIPSAGSKKMRWTRWQMDTGMRSSRNVGGCMEELFNA